MVRTKDSASGTRAVAAKAPRKSLGGGSAARAAASSAISAATSSSRAANKYGGGNTYNPQPTPEWQKPLTSFFTRDPNVPVKEKKTDDEEMDKEEIDIKGKGKGKGKGKSSKIKKTVVAAVGVAPMSSARRYSAT
jgi:hypothetical protein